MIRSISLALIVTTSVSPAWSRVRIDVSYDQIINEAQPDRIQFTGRGGTSIILNDNGSVTKASTGGVSTNSIDGYVSSINKAGIAATAHYKISNGTIQEYYENEYIRQTIAIRTNGQSLCTAIVTSRAPRGQKYMIWLNPTRYVSQVSAVNVVCRIQKFN